MLEAISDFIYRVISGTILGCFLLVLSLLALWHNFVTAHFRHHHDFRDTRSSKTTIIPKQEPHSPRRQKKRHQSLSVSSCSPLNVEEDEDNNIEFDHTITSTDTRPDSNDSSLSDIGTANTSIDSTYNLANHQYVYDKNFTKKNRSELEDNPFQDVLAAEDMKLVPDLKYYYKQYNIEIEEFEVETEDGFIIDLWHLKHDTDSLEKDNERNPDLHPILMLHGLLQSSGSFASSGRKSLAYFLHQSGFDIWLGNNRCGLKPKWNMSALGFDKRKKWDWDMDQMVQYDLKALIETVLSKCKHEKLTLMSHSQGTTQGFMGLVNGELLYGTDFKLSEKLENFVALAPAVYPGPLLDEKQFVKFMAKGIDNPWIFGNKAFLPLMLLMKKITNGVIIIPFMSYVMFNYLFDWNDSLWDKPLRDRHFLFSPVYISVKLMQWWLSPLDNKMSFKKGAGTLFPDSKTWFPVEDGNPVAKPEGLHLNSTRQSKKDYPHFMMFIPRQDRLVDGERLINHFINHESNSLYKIWYIDEYSHLDVLWAHDVIDRIGQPIVENLRLPKRSQVGRAN
ncbi:hypothetical protein HG535_0A05430 [Zygotorulaspora mrakii]|uniref:sterol esterase n=1 Tax=Zygotorulaspora mrakii TaxID=42260 RepID=A0A7H9AYF5_ZYGMR|nr:uncharacterized protein HG535_0A05430 [Zygotorulaspora mrakii]QLG70602.1 hypothetical protein HG535_0A05430 [Zygotorulaspora mrakii]